MTTHASSRWRAGVALLLAMATGAAHADGALGADAARRLLTRAGFAPSETEVRAYAPLTPRAAVDRLLEGTRTEAATAAPAWIDAPIVTLRDLRAMSDEQRRAERAAEFRRGLELRAWWLREMSTTSSPLTERMTLFWHNHFVAAQPKVRWSQWMYRQNVTLRRHALGSFGALLHAEARDPALLVYLDAAANRRGAPNENFARELMELFTLGEGRFGEADVREAARAFTGWSVDPAQGSFVFRRALHDDGRKTVLGRTGRFTGDDVIELLLAHPATAEFIVAKLWREFVSPAPDPRRVAELAARFRTDGYELKPLLRDLLLQPEVIAAGDDTALVKSPVELVIGLVRQSDAALANPAGAAIAVAGMGQNLFAPPNVRGWVGGEAWINTQTLLARKQFLEQALVPARGAAMAPSAASMERDDEDSGAAQAAFRRRMERAAASAVRVDTDRWLRSLGGLAAERPLGAVEVQQLARAVSAQDAVGAADSMLALDALRAIVLDPTYQLK
jgi:uncharacterized protein (DUF1800 family)